MGATGAGSSYNLLIATWWLERNHVRLASREPAEAARAWNQLEVSFPSKWWAHDWIGWRVMEDVWRPHDPPIHFPLRREGSRYAASPMPGPADCRTVNEAPMAIFNSDCKLFHSSEFGVSLSARCTDYTETLINLIFAKS